MRGQAIAFVLLLTATALSGCSKGAPEPDNSVACSDLIENAGQGTPGHTVVEFTTNKGSFKVELFDAKSPITVQNFLKYVRDGFYDGTLFHRIGKDFMIQGGGMDQSGQMKEGTYPPIKHEATATECRNKEYTISMARPGVDAQGRPNPDLATNQFFINTADNAFLDFDSSNAPGYAVFGIVTEGRDVVDAIESTPTEPYAEGKKCQPDRSPTCPKEDIVIQTVQVV